MPSTLSQGLLQGMAHLTANTQSHAKPDVSKAQILHNRWSPLMTFSRQMGPSPSKHMIASIKHMHQTKLPLPLPYLWCLSSDAPAHRFQNVALKRSSLPPCSRTCAFYCTYSIIRHEEIHQHVVMSSPQHFNTIEAAGH